MVAWNKNLGAIKPAQQEWDEAHIHCKIAKIIHQVVCADDLVPSSLHSDVHRVCAYERPVTVSDNVGMSEMMIGSEPSFHLLSLHC
ncbi:MAG: hypothetical protein K2X27_20430 [Candidatus Obscuribacterales bacterium]|nr:hypothetical protein [Candidatus Obscuribacterales bacterium]